MMLKQRKRGRMIFKQARIRFLEFIVIQDDSVWLIALHVSKSMIRELMHDIYQSFSILSNIFDIDINTKSENYPIRLPPYPSLLMQKYRASITVPVVIGLNQLPQGQTPSTTPTPLTQPPHPISPSPSS